MPKVLAMVYIAFVHVLDYRCVLYLAACID